MFLSNLQEHQALYLWESLCHPFLFLNTQILLILKMPVPRRRRVIIRRAPIGLRRRRVIRRRRIVPRSRPPVYRGRGDYKKVIGNLIGGALAGGALAALGPAGIATGLGGMLGGAKLGGALGAVKYLAGIGKYRVRTLRGRGAYGTVLYRRRRRHYC